MLHLCSKGCEYALQAFAALEPQDCRDGFSLGAVCQKAKVPEPYTRKIFQTLVKSGVLEAKRGPGGGYGFARDPSKLSVLSVIYAIDGKQVFEKCVMKDSECSATKPCSLHESWQKTKSDIIRQLDGYTIEKFIIHNK